jgi:hypothetical protein
MGVVEYCGYHFITPILHYSVLLAVNAPVRKTARLPR